MPEHQNDKPTLRQDVTMFCGPILHGGFFSNWLAHHSTVEIWPERVVLFTRNLIGGNARFELRRSEVLVRRKRHAIFLRKLVFEHTRADCPLTIELLWPHNRVLAELNRLGYATREG